MSDLIEPWKLTLLPMIAMWLAWRWQLGFKDSWLRCWAAMMAGSVAANFFDTTSAYILIDLLAAAIILARPAITIQRHIGTFSVCMAMASLGHWCAVNIKGSKGDPAFLADVLNWLGWAQLALLVGWGIYDHYKPYFRWDGPRWHIRPRNKANIR